MGNVRSCIVTSFSVFSVYVVYVHVYRAHKVLKSNVLHSDRLPSLVYVGVRYLYRAITRRSSACLHPRTHTPEVIYTLLNCRLQSPVLRRFCSVAGYGWDYPDSEYRDIPLCFPEFLCCRLMLILLTDGQFRLNPAGLIRVRQSLQTFQPIDELKKGPFTLQAQVLEYRQTDVGVEVDVRLSATSRCSSPVWESVLTLLSANKPHRLEDGSQCEVTPDQPEPEDMRQVELRVPRTTGLQCVWSFSDFSPQRLLSVPGRFFGFRSQTSPSLWMLSVCLAEIEKHKGVGVIAPPASVTAQFKEPVFIPGKVTLRFWEQTRKEEKQSDQGVGFSMEQHGRRVTHMVGRISRS